ncbi:hypothetical protein HanPI659440_Chr01g0013771 [Helianthus annuus]|nr:hypothetical protein HanPI659440_Chr01g0013771 [Helianthus annuus]
MRIYVISPTFEPPTTFKIKFDLTHFSHYKYNLSYTPFYFTHLKSTSKLSSLCIFEELQKSKLKATSARNKSTRLATEVTDVKDWGTSSSNGPSSTIQGELWILEDSIDMK